MKLGRMLTGLLCVQGVRWVPLEEGEPRLGAGRCGELTLFAQVKCNKADVGEGECSECLKKNIRFV